MNVGDRVKRMRKHGTVKGDERCGGGMGGRKESEKMVRV